ncbi:MAG: DegT/DnrJ/EryC1/StrS family aminotransferase [Oscillospiraceae bacterium]|nr:DegT/DnrJ/EryC1/StrS family aminotransferase [Oscillospiraceae bacterium]
MEKLALHGGEKAKKSEWGTGKRFGEPELQQLKEALDQETLFYWFGNKVKALCEKFKTMYGSKYCVATSSGTASIHVALGAAGVTEGDEVIVSPITDMGSVIGILYQNAIPVFADLDPHTYNMTAETIEACISEKTKAVVVVHLAGNPAEMDEIMALAKKHNITVVEDCAQSYECFYKGRKAGSIGDFGCFSLNDFKHISAGDGGMVLTNDEESFYTAAGFADKNYDRYQRDVHASEIPFIAPNYRMNELTGAVGLAQLDRVEGICARRNEIGMRLTEALKDLPGVYPPEVKDYNKSSYWFYMLRIDEKEAGCTREEFSEALAAEGIPNQPGYIPFCVYMNKLFLEKTGYMGTHAPFDSKYYGKEIEYKAGLCPNAEEILNTAIRFGISEFFTDTDVEEIIHAFRKVSAYFQSKK